MYLILGGSAGFVLILFYLLSLILFKKGNTLKRSLILLSFLEFAYLVYGLVLSVSAFGLNMHLAAFSLVIFLPFIFMSIAVIVVASERFLMTVKSEELISKNQITISFKAFIFIFSAGLLFFSISVWFIFVFLFRKNSEGAYAYMNAVSVLGIFVYFLAGLIAYYICRAVKMPVVIINRFLKKLNRTEGDLTEKVLVPSNDEHHYTGWYLNSYLASLHGMFRIVYENAVRTDSFSEGIEKNTERTIQAIGSQLKSLKTAVSAFNDESRLVDNLRKTVKDMESGNADVLKSISAKRDEVKEITNSVEKTVEAMSKTVEMAESAKNNSDSLKSIALENESVIDDTFRAVESISSKSREIEEVTDIISGIAKKTNLLAMNAAIEAAHAGEAGKGFAVVADEIRKLADDSDENVKIISDALNGIIESIKLSSEKFQKARYNYETIFKEISVIADATEEVARTLEIHMKGIRDLGAAVREILTVINDSVETLKSQKNSTEEMAEVFNRLAHLSETNTAILEREEEKSKVVLKDINRVRETGSAIRQYARQLLNNFSQFKFGQSEAAAGPEESHERPELPEDDALRLK